jgi:hypothetical protein
MFEIGEVVICVDDSILAGKEAFVAKIFPNWVKKDERYTIRAFVDNQGIVTGVLLEELENPDCYIHLVDAMQEPAFRTDRFRKRQPDEKLESEEADEAVGELLELLEYESSI